MVSNWLDKKVLYLPSKIHYKLLENLKEFGPMEIGPDMGALFGRKCAILWYHTSVSLVRYPLKNGLAYWTGHLTWA